LRKRSRVTAAVLELARTHGWNVFVTLSSAQLVPDMDSVLRLRDHMSSDQPANVKWIADQIMLSLTNNNVAQRILLNDGADAEEWMEAAQVVR
jgi:hypothetical protein